MRYTRQGVSIEYDDIGNGVPAVDPRLPVRSGVVAGSNRRVVSLYRVIAPDLRGFGQSSETTGEAVSMDQYAADLKSLLDSLNIKQAVVGGISMGGYIALAFYAQYADRDKGLLLASTRATDNKEGKQTRITNAQKIGETGPRFLIDAMAPQMLGSAPRSKIESPCGHDVTPARARSYVGLARHGGPPRSDRSAPLCDSPNLDLVRHR